MLFTAGGKKYLCHRIIYEVFKGLIKDGFVIDHFDSNPQNNSLDNLQCISQSENSKRGQTGKHANRSKRVISFDLENNEERVFHSMNSAGKHFGICSPSIRKVAEGIYQTAVSKKNGHRSRFSYS